MTREWIVLGVTYLLTLVLFRLLGNLSAAGRAIQRWGRAAATTRSRAASSS